MSRVLIVEDNELNRGLMRYLLKAVGHQCLEAEDGRAGVDLAREAHPDIILMDLQMPELNGYGALAALRDDEELAEIPVIAVTAYSMKGDRERALEAGFDGYITKPIDPRTFAETITASVGARTVENTTGGTTEPANGDVRVSHGMTSPLDA